MEQIRPTYFENCHHALALGIQRAPCGICWKCGKGWTPYAPDNPPAGITPEIVILKRDGLTSLFSLTWAGKEIISKYPA